MSTSPEEELGILDILKIGGFVITVIVIFVACAFNIWMAQMIHNCGQQPHAHLQGDIESLPEDSCQERKEWLKLRRNQLNMVCVGVLAMTQYLTHGTVLVLPFLFKK